MEIDIGVLIYQLKLFFLMILAGWGAYSAGLLTEELHDRLNTIIMRLIIPALLVSNMALGGGDENRRLILPMLVGGFAIFGILIASGAILSMAMGQKGDLKKVQIGITAFGSTGFFGIPLAAQVLGPVGTAAFGIYSIVDNLMVWTLGLALSSGKEEEREAVPASVSLRRMVQPATIAVFIGLILFVADVPKDMMVLTVLEKIGSCSNPLAMICIGASIARSDIRRIYRGWPSVTVVAVKMVICPVIVYSACRYLHVYEPAGICLTFIAAIPASSMFSIMCKENGNMQADYASRASIITVLSSIFTFPLVAWMIGRI